MIKILSSPYPTQNVCVCVCVCVSQYVLVDAPSCQVLAAVTLQLLQFQEDAFGRQAASPALTKLPVSLSLTVIFFFIPRPLAVSSLQNLQI